jgi:hypothetical protein
LDILDRVYKSMLTMAIMSGLSLLIMSAMLPKGVPITKLPQFLMAMKRKYNGADLDQMLRAMQNEDEMAQVIAQMSPGYRPPPPPVTAAPLVQNAQQKSVVIDPADLDALDKMNISGAMKDELRRSYMQNGAVSGMSLKEVIEKAHAKEEEVPHSQQVADNGMSEDEFDEIMGLMRKPGSAQAVPAAAPTETAAPNSKPVSKANAKSLRSYEQAFRDFQAALDYKKQKPSN